MRPHMGYSRPHPVKYHLPCQERQSAVPGTTPSPCRLKLPARPRLLTGIDVGLVSIDEAEESPPTGAAIPPTPPSEDLLNGSERRLSPEIRTRCGPPLSQMLSMRLVIFVDGDVSHRLGAAIRGYFAHQQTVTPTAGWTYLAVCPARDTRPNRD